MACKKWLAAAIMAVLSAACGDESEPPSGGGGTGGCVEATSCTEPLDDCRVPTCEAGVCGSALAPEGASCSGGGRCTADGVCLASNGAPCAEGGTCASGLCVDGVCCADPCDGKCASCNVAGSEGSCTFVPFPLDPDGECPAEGSCNGLGECSGALLGVAGFGSSSGDSAYALATTAAGVRIGGFYAGSINFGGAQLGLAGLTDPFVAAFDSALTHAWSTELGSPSTDLGVVETVIDLATDSAGNTLVTLLLKGQADLGGGPLGVDGETHAIVLKLDPGGGHLWSKDFGKNCEGRVEVGVGPSDRVVVVTCFQGTVDFGGGPITTSQSAEFAVVSLTSGGAHEYTTHWGAGMDSPTAVVVDAAGNAYVAGTLVFPYDFGGGTLTPGSGGLNGLIVKLDPTGQHVWSRTYGGDAATNARSLAVGPSGLVMSGTFSSPIDFGGGVLTPQGGDAFVLRLDLDGNHVWSRKIGGPSSDHASVNFDHQENVLVAGQIYGSGDFAGLESPAGNFDLDVLAGKIAADGTAMWVRRYTTMGTGYDIAADADDSIYVTGDYNDTFANLLTGNGSYDIFLLKLAP